MQVLEFNESPLSGETKAEHLQRVKELSKIYHQRHHDLYEDAKMFAARLYHNANEYEKLGYAADTLADRLYKELFNAEV